MWYRTTGAFIQKNKNSSTGERAEMVKIRHLTIKGSIVLGFINDKDAFLMDFTLPATQVHILKF